MVDSEIVGRGRLSPGYGGTVSPQITFTYDPMIVNLFINTVV